MSQSYGELIQNFDAQVAGAATADAKGTALETLMMAMFGSIPGVAVIDHNVVAQPGHEEIDIGLWNDPDPQGLTGFESIILVECKNWTGPVGYPEIVAFKDKLVTRGLTIGILIAAAGITGDPTMLTDAHNVIATALADERHIVVVTLDELEHTGSSAELVRLLKKKRLSLVLRRTSLP